MEEDSQVRYEDENSMNSAGVPVERGSDQTLNAEEGTGRPVTESTGRPVTRRLKSSTTEFGLKATRQWNAGCRELTLPRNDGSSTPKGWIRGSTKICSVGRNKFVKDLTEKARTLGINDENDSEATGRLVQQETKIVKHSRTKADKPAAKAKPKPTSAPPSSHSHTSIPIQEREWHDVEPQEHKSKDAPSLTVSKKMFAFLRHGTLLRDQDGAAEFWKLNEEFRSGFPNFVCWPKKDFSFVLILLDHEFFTSGLSKVIPERILWIRLYWTTC